MISPSNTIFSELIGKLPIITVNILVLKMYHTIVSIFVTVTWTCDSKSLLYNMLVYIVTYVHIVT